MPRIKAGESKGGVEYIITRNKLGNMFIITTEVGGQLPAEFQGEFTSPRNAQSVIDAYLIRRSGNGKSIG